MWKERMNRAEETKMEEWRMEEEEWNRKRKGRKMEDKWENELKSFALKELTIIYGMF